MKKPNKVERVQPQRSGRPIGAGLGAAGLLRLEEPPPRLPGEQERHYQWFQQYWRQGATVSLRELARRLKVAAPHLAYARKAGHWDARVAAALEEPPEVKADWVARREALRAEEWEMHRECLEAGREALQRWRHSRRPPALGDVVRLLEFAARVARLAAGLPERHLAVSGEDGEPIRVQFEEALARAYGPVVEVAAEVAETSGAPGSEGARA